MSVNGNKESTLISTATRNLHHFGQVLVETRMDNMVHDWVQNVALSPSPKTHLWTCTLKWLEKRKRVRSVEQIPILMSWSASGTQRKSGTKRLSQGSALRLGGPLDPAHVDLLSGKGKFLLNWYRVNKKAKRLPCWPWEGRAFLSLPWDIGKTVLTEIPDNAVTLPTYLV